MSIRKKPKQAVDFLLARLDKAKEQVLQQDATENANGAIDKQSLSSKFDVFKTELESMRDVLPNIISWEKSIMDHFCELEQELDNDIFNDPKKKSEVNDKLDLMTAAIRESRELIPRVDKEVSKLRSISFIKPGDVPTDDHIDDYQTVCQEWVDLKVDNRLLETDVMSSFLTSFHCLSGSQQAKMCSLCLSVFPMNSIIEKRPLIYWWMGEGLVIKSRNKTAEEVGEQVFKELLDEGFIKPSSKNKNLSVNSFIVDPWIHRMLILIAKENSFVEFSPQWTPCNGKRRSFLCQENNVSHSTRISGEKEAEELMMVFNVNEQYLHMEPERLSNLKKVEVLQMGRWQACVSDHHIEVVDQALLDRLGSQKRLKYLSLRGISRIETLPASISKLTSLQILDLRACHNLEKLPPAVSKLKNLTHLDVSQCYLLESMPKGLEHLVALQVLKGFVIGKAEKNSCKISDLTRLEKLRKLSIRVGNGQQDDQLSSLGSFSALSILTISWGATSVSNGVDVSLPVKLTKLDLRCVPFEAVPSWLKQGTGTSTSTPSNLVKLYIIGGKLKSLDPKVIKDLNVQCLRLKYLKDLKIDKREWKKDLKIDEREWKSYKYLDKTSYELDVCITSDGAA